MDGADAAVLLIDPKTPFNVATTIRACAIFGVPTLRYTGDRMDERLEQEVGLHGKHRIPREERMKDYEGVNWQRTELKRPLDIFVANGYTPVCVEVLPNSQPLDTFVHPPKALYVFGPEDGTLDKGIRTACHRFVRIATKHRTPLNLAQAVNVVLYDRYVKSAEYGAVDYTREQAEDYARLHDAVYAKHREHAEKESGEVPALIGCGQEPCVTFLSWNAPLLDRALVRLREAVK